MPNILSNSSTLINQDFSAIFDSALRRFGSLLPPEVEVLVDLKNQHSRVRAKADALEDVLFSACMLSWVSSGGPASQVMIESSEVMLDNIVLGRDAEILQGGIPPRLYVRLLFSNSALQPQGGSHQPMQHAPVDGASSTRLKLADMQKVLTQHKGTITAMVDAEKGTSFEIYLPTVRPFSRANVESTGSSIKHIVYVDDYKEMRELAAEFLTDSGFRTTAFEKGSEVLNLLATNSLECDAVVSDYRLVGLSGIELLKRIKELRPHLPVVILTGYVDDALRGEAEAYGASLVLSKTDDFNDLCMSLRQLLQSEPTPEEGSFSDWATL